MSTRLCLHDDLPVQARTAGPPPSVSRRPVVRSGMSPVRGGGWGARSAGLVLRAQSSSLRTRSLAPEIGCLG